MEISLLIDRPETTAQVAQWYFDKWACKDPNTTPQTVANKVSLSANKHSLPLAFVLHAEGQLAGVAEIKYRELPELPGFTCWLDGVYVPPEHRGRGFSTALIEYAKKLAVELSLSSLHLSCEEHNVALYTRRGFKVVKQLSDRYIMEYRFFNGNISVV